VATILLIEDDASAAKALSKHLEKVGHTVLALSSGEAALAYLDAEAQLPDAVLCDLGLPGVSGVVVVEAIRASDRSAKLPVICSSSQKGMHDHALALEAGADAFIEKPIKPATLEATLARLLAGR
jgi:DNA-binding response OmpR family regulator